MFTAWKARIRALKADVVALWLACRDPRVPWPARVLAMGVVAYALSPIDLIPDAIPVIGYLDDLILVPAGLWLVRRMIPPDVLADCRLRADAVVDRPVSRTAAVVIVAFWLTLATALTLTGWRWWRHGRG